MATETNATPLAKFGPVGAPVLGGVLLVLFVAVAYMGGDVSAGRDALTSKVREVNTRLDEKKGMLDSTPLPSLRSVAEPMTIKERPAPAPIQNSDLVNTLPTVFKAIVQDIEQSELEKYDTDEDGAWQEAEFRDTPYYVMKENGQPSPLSIFKNWDRNNDGKIDQAEYKDPPIDEQGRFRKLDTLGGGTLKPPEISPEELAKWDRNGDGEVSEAEFLLRGVPRDDVDLKPVTEVVATADERAMTITASWTAPQLDVPPPDMKYVIERFCPETTEKRMLAFRRAQLAALTLTDQWDDKFKAWLEARSSDTNEIPRKDNPEYNKPGDPEYAKKKYEQETGHLRPVAPIEPTDWEQVAIVDAPKTKYEDRNFDTDVTYVYAVRVMTEKDLKRGVKADRIDGARKFSAVAIQTGRPVRVRNLVMMEFVTSGSPNDAIISLARWQRLGEGDKQAWYQVKIRESLSLNNDTLGGVYGAAQLKDRQVAAYKPGSDTPESAEDLATLLPADLKLDYRTGFRFTGQLNSPAGTLFRHDKMQGEFELPRGKMAADLGTRDSTTMLEIRVLGISPGADFAWFEINRWHQVGQDWYRVEMIQRVARNAQAGGVVTLASPGEGVSIFKAGRKLEGMQLKALGDGTADLTAGKYEGMDGRLIKLPGEKFDLAGALYR